MPTFFASMHIWVEQELNQGGGEAKGAEALPPLARSNLRKNKKF